MDKEEAERFDWVKTRRSTHTGPTGCVEIGRDRWQTASGSEGSPGAVQVGDPDGRCGMIPVRDSHKPEVVVWVPRRDMQLFILGVRDGDFDWILEPEPLPPGVVPIPPGMDALAAN